MNNQNISIHQIIGIIIEKINTNGKVIIKVTGNSMYPFYIDKETEVVLVKPPKILHRKDVVLYKNPDGIWSLHRIIKVKKDCLLICGDALLKIEHISQDSIVAIVKEHYHNNKLISNKLSHRIKVSLWLLFKPFRRYLLAILRKLRKKQ